MSDLSILNTSLSLMIALPDEQAANSLHRRMVALDTVDRIQQISFAERGFIIREFELRSLWKHLTDPDTGHKFPNITSWLSCSTFLGCRRTNFEAKRDMETLSDVPAANLIDVPKGNLKVLTQLSTAVRNQPDILEAAKRLTSNEFLEKVEKEQPHQHIEAKRVLRFSPGRSWAKVIEETIDYAIEQGIAGNRDEALLRMAETSLNEWKLEEEIKIMPESTE